MEGKNTVLYTFYFLKILFSSNRLRSKLSLRIEFEGKENCNLFLLKRKNMKNSLSSSRKKTLVVPPFSGLKFAAFLLT